MTLDLNVVFEHGLRELYDANKRDDWAQPHVSHLGKCLFQTLLSRSGAPEVPKSVRSLQMLRKGLHDEQYIVDVLREGLAKQDPHDGWQVIHSGVLDEGSDLVGHLDVELARAACDHNEWARYGDLTGWYCLCGTDFGTPLRYAADELEIERRLVEIKTTQWKERWESLGEIGKRGLPVKTKVEPGPYPEPSRMYRFQAIGYARRRPLNPNGKHMPYAIFQWDRALNGFHQYPQPGLWYDSDDAAWVAEHDAWTKQVIDLTAPGTDAVAAGIASYNASKGQLEGIPPEPWMCDFCDQLQCGRNTNKDNPLHAIEENVFA